LQTGGYVPSVQASEVVIKEEVKIDNPKKRLTNDLGMEFVYIKPGTFIMGSPEDEPEREYDEVQHEVTLTKGFYMQTTPVTQKQWTDVMGNNPSHFKDGGDNCPVETVSWDDVQEYITRLNEREETDFRLPTEAEWESACRAGTTTPFYTGKCLGTDEANYNGDYPLKGCSKGIYREKTTPVKSFSPNLWGLYDMHGNVLEWCQDWFGDYPDKPVVDPTGAADGSDRVMRGGYWGNPANWCRSGYRRHITPYRQNQACGFRLVLSPGQG